MKIRFLACAGLIAALSVPALAQGLRSAPLLGASRPAVRDTGPQPADYIVAVVNSEPITNYDVRLRLVRFEQQLAQQGAALPPRAQLAREVLERLIAEKAQLQLAQELGVRVEEAMVNRAEESVVRQNGLSVPELRRRLAAEGLDVAQYRQDLRNQILLQRLRDRELEPRARVSELDIDQFLREQQQGNADPALTELNSRTWLVPPSSPT